jgi:hypothetical protein
LGISWFGVLATASQTPHTNFNQGIFYALSFYPEMLNDMNHARKSAQKINDFPGESIQKYYQ